MALCPPTDIMTDTWILFATPHTDGSGRTAGDSDSDLLIPGTPGD